jgi:hypothetical protein
LRSFDDLDALIGLVPAHVVNSLSAIDFGRGSEALYRDQMPGLLTELADRARVLSITASSAIEGVIVANAIRFSCPACSYWTFLSSTPSRTATAEWLAC